MKQTQIPHLPIGPGVYTFFTKGKKRLYIGKAKNIHKRIQQYFSPGSIRKQDMVHKAHHLEYISTTSESEAILLEENLIREHRPPYNSLLKGEGSYTYIKIPHEPYPRITLTRFRDNDKATYIGPKFNKRELREILKVLRQLFAYRGCTNTEFAKGKICSDYFFGLCSGWCIYAKLSSSKFESYHEHAHRMGFRQTFTSEADAIREYKKITNMIKYYFTGKSATLEKYVKKQMQTAIMQENFERAAKLRDVYIQLSQFVEKQHVFLDKKVNGIVSLIEQIGNYRIVVILVFQNGKVSDVIRFHRHSNDTDQDIMLRDISIEYDDNLVELNPNTFLSKEIKNHFRKKTNDISAFLDKVKSSYIAQTHMTDHNLLEELLLTLKKHYSLKHFPYKIECIDISHLSGSRISGGLSTMEGGMLSKRNYRRYKIQSVENRGTYSDDYQSLKEIMIRRFNLGAIHKPDELWPQLFILDGGKGQLSLVSDLIQEFPDMRIILKHVDVIALGKGGARLRSGKNRGSKEYIYTLQSDSENGLRVADEAKVIQYNEADRLLLKLRDEAHRFANKYRTKQMQQERQS